MNFKGRYGWNIESKIQGSTIPKMIRMAIEAEYHLGDGQIESIKAKCDKMAEMIVFMVRLMPEQQQRIMLSEFSVYEVDE